MNGDGTDAEAIASLNANRIDPKFLYVTPRQAELWRQVSFKHSPIHANPEFARIYREAFAKIVHRLAPGKVALVGLGSGTGRKELDLYTALKTRGHAATFFAVDVSPDLVLESMQKLVSAGAAEGGSLVCDLADSAFLAPWLDQKTGDLPRLLTFFGIIPNLAPAVVAELFRRLLRPGDILLVSVHLAPVDDHHPLAAAMELVLPQYNNPETCAWLAAALEQWNLLERVAVPEIKIGEIDGLPAFLGLAAWKTSEPFEQWGYRFAPAGKGPLQVFQSLRYTPSLFESAMQREGFRAEMLAITGYLQEAIWAITVP
jgi:SAM-dependent methyltransferase